MPWASCAWARAGTPPSSIRDNPDLAQELEQKIRQNSFKLLSKQGQAAARAAGRAVDVSADDFEDGEE